MMEINFKGKRALVTGAGRGMGRGTAKALVQCGAEVIALDKTQADLDTLVKEVPSIKPLCVDLSNIEEAMKAIEAQGDIHLLVNNAGINDDIKFMEMKAEDFDMTTSINVKAPLFVAQTVARKMISGGCGGSIVNVSSLASKIAVEGFGIYCCSKAALDMLTKVMALELGPHKIRVNAVNPTIVRGTRLGEEPWKDKQDDFKAFMNAVPLKRFPEIQDVVDTILYLLSDKAAMVNGVQLLVDGGTSVH